jgi:3-hydroxyacyl-CoA dehydrogenase
MGGGIAMTFADAGIAVSLIDSDPAALARVAATLKRVYDGRVAKGRLTADEAARRLESIELGGGDAEIARADLALEAVFESLALKREIFARFSALCRPDALLASNTSTLDIDAIAAAAEHPERCLGLHFFSPAHVMRLLEIVRGAETSEATIARARQLAERLGKIGIVVGNCDGFVGNRMLLGYRREAEFLVLDGASPARVDAALQAFGFAMGPFAVADLAGIDIGWRAKRERIERGTAPPFALTDLSDRLVEAGRLGQKTGAGYYRYEPGKRTPLTDPALDDVLAAARAAAGRTTRTIGAEEIVARCVYALINEGARILGEGIAESAADVDAIWVNGYGFPAARGGPLRYADEVGPARVLATIERYADADPAFWHPAPRLIEIARAGSNFEDERAPYQV